jgi:hypothetical protein
VLSHQICTNKEGNLDLGLTVLIHKAYGTYALVVATHDQAKNSRNLNEQEKKEKLFCNANHMQIFYFS